MKYLIGALVILALLFLAWWMFSRGKQRQLEEHRAEAARIRAGADEHQAAVRGQETFAQQAGERAAVARHEAEERARLAEESAREAQRVEEEARAQQRELERVRLQRDAELRRADELDPDVEVADDDPRPLPEDLDDDVRSVDDTRVHRPVESRDESGAGGAAARLASGVDYSDHPTAHDDRSDRDLTTDDARGATAYEPRDERDVTGGEGRTHEATADDERTDHGATEYAGTSTDGTADRVEHGERQGHDMTQHHDDDTTRPDEHAEGTRSTEQGDGDMAIIADIEDYASTEPLPMDEQSPAEGREERSTDYDGSRDDVGDQDVTSQERTSERTSEDMQEDDGSSSSAAGGATAGGSTLAGASVAGADTERRSSTDEDSTSELGSRSDETSDSDLGSRSDEGSDSDRTSDSDRMSGSERDLDAEPPRADTGSALGSDSDASRTEGGDAGHWPDGTDRVNTLDDDSARGGDVSGGQSGRRISGFGEIRDGGYGVGSAAPLDDRAQPLDHPIQGNRDTMSYRTPGSSGYDSGEPDVWFYDEDAARRAGFNPAEG